MTLFSAELLCAKKDLIVFQKIPDAERHQQLADVAAMMRSSAELRALTEIVQRDAMRTFAAGDVPMDTIWMFFLWTNLFLLFISPFSVQPSDVLCRQSPLYCCSLYDPHFKPLEFPVHSTNANCSVCCAIPDPWAHFHTSDCSAFEWLRSAHCSDTIHPLSVLVGLRTFRILRNFLQKLSSSANFRLSHNCLVFIEQVPSQQIGQNPCVVTCNYLINYIPLNLCRPVI